MPLLSRESPVTTTRSVSSSHPCSLISDLFVVSFRNDHRSDAFQASSLSFGITLRDLHRRSSPPTILSLAPRLRSLNVLYSTSATVAPGSDGASFRFPGRLAPNS